MALYSGKPELDGTRK